MMRVPLPERCLSKFAIERYRSCQTVFSSSKTSGSPSLRRISG